jgi:glucose/arabinose dehydrogenase
MRLSRWFAWVIPICLLALLAAVAVPAEPTYVKKATRVESVVASLKASGLPALDGKWYYIGPFNNADGDGFDHAYPPEKEIDLTKTYDGKGETAAWKEFANFRLGKVVDLKKFKSSDFCLVYLYHEIDAPEDFELPLSLGSDDSLVVFLNGQRILADNAARAAAPDQNETTLKLKKGKNQLLIKVGNIQGDWAVYVAPGLPAAWPSKVRKQLDKDFPESVKAAPKKDNAAEAKHYKIVTLPVPKDVVLEVGGLAMRPDGKLLACTRRGEVWLVSNPNADDPADVKFKRFASGLHEALGLHVDSKDVYVVQRPELTKLVDKDGDDVADEYVTVCDKWGVSGDYHEFAFGPARDKQGNFYVTLNVGFGGGHQSKAPWRGWCVQITPKGELVPYATGLRSPNGINFSPDGDLFYTDNQGEWVATNKLHHVKKGEYYGHPAGLRWVKQSPFADTLKESYPSNMLYDGQRGKADKPGMPQSTPPCVWFPYGRMGQSISEPIWDTTSGKFGPFAGQMLVGDQNKSLVMRVYLEKVNGRFQGACFPFRGGFASGVNRLCFGPDGSLYVGTTDRGWGSTGGSPYGLQRLVYTGVVPFEIHAMRLTKDGFDLTFTKPLDPGTAEKLERYNLSSFTHYYWGTYGSPEMDAKAEKIRAVTVSADGKAVSLKVDGLRVGRIYEVNLNGVKSADGEAVLHPVGYYTLNDLVK